jgi:multisubunit Na+/H+ antiporter MnhC subunit
VQFGERAPAVVMALYISAGLVAIAATIYFVIRSREFVKFLAGAFFVSAGVQLYLWWAGVAVPLVGTDFIQTPAVSAVRWIPHFLFFLVTLYFGYFRKPRATT